MGGHFFAIAAQAPASNGEGRLKILGVDPGTAVAGYGLIERRPGRSGREELGCLAAGQISGGRGYSLSARLRTIFESLTALIHQFQPDAVAVEEPFVDKNIQTALKLGQAEGVALLAAELAGVPVMIYPPATIKLALTGYGRAEKHQVGQMVGRLLRLKEPLTSHHATDALAVAICHAHSAPMSEAIQRPLGKQRGLGVRGHRSTLLALMRTGPRIQ
ncbi:MAG: crossover junction endodeoxyribonuclease RuvC [Nitrospirota bacterium]